MIPSLGLVLLAYVVGSIPTGLWMGKLVGGIDVRSTGSHRTGATNVQRSLGTRAGILVLLIDFAKGGAVVLATRALTGSDSIAALAGLAAVIGHIWPVLAGFRGGRGVATGAGAVSALAPLAVLLAFITLVVVVLVTRYVSLGSIAAGLLGAIWVALLLGHTPESPAAIPLALLCGALVVLKHADNVHRLLRGEESRLGQAPKEPA